MTDGFKHLAGKPSHLKVLQREGDNIHNVTNSSESERESDDRATGQAQTWILSLVTPMPLDDSIGTFGP